MNTDREIINKTYTFEYNFNSNDDKQLFQLFYWLIKPLKELESKIQLRESINKKRLDAYENVRPSLITIVFQSIRYTIIFAVPFLILFFIVTNVIHLNNGQTLYSLYDTWAGNLFFVKPVLSWYSSFGYRGIFKSLMLVLIISIFCFVIVPCITVLFPIAVLVNSLLAIVVMVDAKKVLKNGAIEIKRLDVEIDTMCSNLARFLYFVPKDYRYSIALEHFCSSYNNGRASNLKEAIEAFKTDMHRAQLENEQQQILNAQLNILKEIQYQGMKIDSLKHTVDRVKNKVDWL